MLFPSFRDFPSEESGRKVSEKKVKKNKLLTPVNAVAIADCMQQIDFNTANSLELVSPNLQLRKHIEMKRKEVLPDILQKEQEENNADEELEEQE